MPMPGRSQTAQSRARSVTCSDSCSSHAYLPGKSASTAARKPWSTVCSCVTLCRQ
ncbi:hypothetical protein Ctob_004873 [Chrysochromulina tobinii]|uniref:Uncharacterized protein n=1 Tax=Chrysochromulina tobinii TaxID=1460289 RepID=A0A0M0J5B7_9EUKA|nr:hypothetical protein Ctob_004873 [Chrysochromulina tobinii]|eukprot:KOO21814.1 hypothetical protein Ctob_004873 [Chrysochromulina sp. CCMP291]